MCGQHGQTRARNRQQRLGRDQQSAPVDGIGYGPAAEREDEDRDELDEGQQPDGERAVGELPQLEGQGYDRDLATEAVDELTQPEHPEVAVALDRLEVHEQTPKAATIRAG